jgi:hypothetical protein
MVDLSEYGGTVPGKGVVLPENATVKDLQLNYKYVEMFTSKTTRWHVKLRAINSTDSISWLLFSALCPVCKEPIRFIWQSDKFCSCVHGHYSLYNKLIVVRTNTYRSEKVKQYAKIKS